MCLRQRIHVRGGRRLEALWSGTPTDGLSSRHDVPTAVALERGCTADRVQVLLHSVEAIDATRIAAWCEKPSRSLFLGRGTCTRGHTHLILGKLREIQDCSIAREQDVKRESVLSYARLEAHAVPRPPDSTTSRIVPPSPRGSVRRGPPRSAETKPKREATQHSSAHSTRGLPCKAATPFSAHAAVESCRTWRGAQIDGEMAAPSKEVLRPHIWADAAWTTTPLACRWVKVRSLPLTMCTMDFQPREIAARAREEHSGGYVGRRRAPQAGARSRLHYHCICAAWSWSPSVL